MGRKTVIFIIVAILCVLIAVFVFSLRKIVMKLSEDKQAKDEYDALSALVRSIEEQTDAVERQDGGKQADATQKTGTQSDIIILTEDEASPSILPQYAPLYEQNKDFFGWIRIEGTPIDYPVMYTPADPEYYLKRDFYGNPINCGTLFVDGGCPPDGCFYLIYGHNMKNKTMFGTLSQYAKQSFWETYQTVQFDTLYEKRTYTVMAAFYSKAYDESQTDVFRYFAYRDLSDPAVFEEYVAAVQSASLYDTGIDAAYGDELITLSTCDRYTKNGRFVVVAKRVS